MALEYDKYVEVVMSGHATVCQGQYLPGAPLWEETAHYYPGGDFDGANALLDEAGYPVKEDGWRMHIELMARPKPNFGASLVDTAIAIKHSLEKVKIDAYVTVYEPAEYYRRVLDFAHCPEFMYIQPLDYEIVSTPGISADMFTGGPNRCCWNATSSGVDVEGRNIWETQFKMYMQIMQERDFDKRMRMWVEYDKYMLEYGPIIKIFSPNLMGACTGEIDGFFLTLQVLWPSIFWLKK